MRFGNSYYLRESGASELVVPTGFSLTGLQKDGPKILEDDKGKFWYVSISGIAQFREAVEEIIHSVSSRDPFFSGRGGRIAYTEIRPENVERKCVTQHRRKAICAIFALNNLTAAELLKGGIDAGKIRVVDYASGGSGGSSHIESLGQKISRIMDWVKGRDEQLWSSLYRLLTAAEDGKPVTRPDELESAVAQQVLNHLEAIQQAVTDGELADSAAILEYAQKLVGEME